MEELEELVVGGAPRNNSHPQNQTAALWGEKLLLPPYKLLTVEHIASFAISIWKYR